MIKNKKLFRYEWWNNNQKYVKYFGSKKQAQKYIDENYPKACNVDYVVYENQIERDNKKN